MVRPGRAANPQKGGVRCRRNSKRNSKRLYHDCKMYQNDCIINFREGCTSRSRPSRAFNNLLTISKTYNSTICFCGSVENHALFYTRVEHLWSKRTKRSCLHSWRRTERGGLTVQQWNASFGPVQLRKARASAENRIAPSRPRASFQPTTTGELAKLSLASSR